MEERERLREGLAKKIKLLPSKTVYGVELTMNAINNGGDDCNPGVMGSGLLSANLSAYSLHWMKVYSVALEMLYRGTEYNNCQGSVFQDELRFMN
jgi:23S rRNA (adenine2030-N6)-methyltransferase